MKILAITVMVYMYSAVYTIIIDMISGNSFSKALRLLRIPFVVMTKEEYTVIVLLVGILFIRPVIVYGRNVFGSDRQ